MNAQNQRLNGLDSRGPHLLLDHGDNGSASSDLFVLLDQNVEYLLELNVFHHQNV